MPILIVITALLLSTACSVKKPIRVVDKPARDALHEWVAAVGDGLKDAGQASASLGTVAGRNLAITYSEAAILSRYTALRNSFLNGRAASKVAFDILDLGLTAAIPITNGSRGKTILGSLATGFKGTNLSIDRNVFAEQSTATILSAMDTCVLRERKVLADRSALAVDQYTIYSGYADLTRLFGCTTMAGAMQELSENQAVAAKRAQDTRLLAPVTEDVVNTLREVQSAFALSVAGDKKLAVALLREMKVQGVTEASESKELIAAYRGLSVVLADPGRSAEFVAAARKAGLIPPAEK